jgi:hypothetical protein
MGELMNFDIVMEILAGADKETISENPDSSSFEYGQALINLEFQRVIVTDWDSFLNSHMVFMGSPFAASDVDINLVTSHPGFQQQPFGLQEMAGFWHIVASVPLDHLHEDSLVTIAYRVAFVANSLAREFAKSEQQRLSFLFR